MTSAGFADWIKQRPIAHRCLHDKENGRLENSLSAAAAAVAHGYSIEVDLHPSSDTVPMVFHDYQLDRLTSESGPFRARDADTLQSIMLCGTGDHIPTLAALLDTVKGQTGLVLELKGMAGEDEGFVAAVLETLAGYRGPVAIMSFSHWLLADARALGATIPVGLTAEGKENLSNMHAQAVEDYQIDFVSYGVKDLPNSFVAGFRASGKPVITWTVRSREQAAFSNLHADQITFEDFLP
jgi:glycerophosphoryl diester phosphodiesterase